jgi:hypothetical protein
MPAADFIRERNRTRRVGSISIGRTSIDRTDLANPFEKIFVVKGLVEYTTRFSPLAPVVHVVKRAPLISKIVAHSPAVALGK